MSVSNAFLKIVRQIHLYLGAFIAPSLLFFALTGGMQVFGLHETTRGSNYHPPAWLVTLAQIHKKQTTLVPAHKLHPAADSAAGTMAAMATEAAIKADPPRAGMKHSLPLKIFFAFVSLGLFLSTVIGLYMAYRYTRKPAWVSAMLAAGTVLPMALALL